MRLRLRNNRLASRVSRRIWPTLLQCDGEAWRRRLPPRIAISAAKIDALTIGGAVAVGASGQKTGFAAAGAGASSYNDIANTVEAFITGVDAVTSIGGDLVARRPTVLLAFAHASCDETERRSLHQLLDSDADVQTKVRELGQFYTDRGVFDKARTLVDKYRQRAHAVSAAGTSPALSELLRFITDVVLK